MTDINVFKNCHKKTKTNKNNICFCFCLVHPAVSTGLCFYFQAIENQYTVNFQKLTRGSMLSRAHISQSWTACKMQHIASRQKWLYWRSRKKQIKKYWHIKNIWFNNFALSNNLIAYVSRDHVELQVFS